MTTTPATSSAATSPATPTGTSPGQAATATGLRKAYGDHVILDGIDLAVAEGTVFSLLGPNGAGKTTIVQILSTLTGADGGELRVGGHDPVRDPDAVRAQIGVTGQFAAVDGMLTGEENLLLMADLHHLGRREGKRRAAELLERFDLTGAAKKLPAAYWLDAESIETESLTVHTPDPDDVYALGAGIDPTGGGD